MAAKSVDPTANPFELLANAENQTIVAPERRKKTANKPAAEEPVGAAQPTPAAKAQARAAKEAAKATKQSDAPGDNQGKQEPAKKKLTREQFEEAKRQGTNLIGEAPASSDVSASTARPPRARGEGGVAGRGRGGGRGRGEGRGRGRGEGQGRGNGEKPGGRGDKDKDHHYQPPAHGREYDKKSAAKTSKNAPFKKGGSGGGGNYGTAQDDLAGQTGADTNVDAPTDETESKTNEKKDKKKYFKGGDEEEESEEFKGTTFEEYLRTTKAAADAELLAKVSTSSQTPRKVEGNLAGAVTKVDEEKKEEKKEKPKVEEKPTAKRTVAVDDIFHVRTPPIRGRGRGRGRGGRGGGRGGKGGDNEEGEAAEEGTEQPTGQQTEQADQSAAQPQQVQGGSRGGKGGRGRGRGEGGRGQGRGGRGQGRGEGSNGRGQGRGGKGQRRPNLDSSNSRHFPDLGTSN